MSIALDVSRMIEAAGLKAPGWGLFVSNEPEKPGNCITVYDTGGGEEDTDELDISSPTFQVRIRCVNYAEGYERHRAIKRMLRQPLLSAGERMYLGFMVTSDIAGMGMSEDKKHHILVASYRSIVQTEE